MVTGREPYAQVPEALLFGGHQPDAIVLYAILDHHAGVKGVGWPSLGLLREELGAAGCGRNAPAPVSERFLQGLLGDLEETGLLLVERNAGPNGVNRYTLPARPQGEATAIRRGLLSPAPVETVENPGPPPHSHAGAPAQPRRPLPPHSYAGGTMNQNHMNQGGAAATTVERRGAALDEPCAACSDSGWVERGRVAYPCTCSPRGATG